FLSLPGVDNSIAATYRKFSFQHQENSIISVNVGKMLTLNCVYERTSSTKIFWYKQSLGQKPRNNPRFALDLETGKNHLQILDVRFSDLAFYYCARRDSIDFEFAAGVFVSVKGSGLNIPASVHQSASGIIQPGGSVTLNCTVHTGTCDGEQSLYWFKHSQESHPGLIYTHGGRSKTQTHTCVYNLPMKNLNLSHAGTYDCVVASCGHILFGNGTTLDFEVDSPVLVYFLSGALTFTTILVVLLAFSVHQMKKRVSYSGTPELRSPAHSTSNAEVNTKFVNLPNRSRRQRNNTDNECVYSSVKH
uniref:Ig-like domain-containing protein n=1 Tax=Sparus aurata TaxID=8175 RepID=A0A671XVR4_SPAAU